MISSIVLFHFDATFINKRRKQLTLNTDLCCVTNFATKYIMKGKPSPFLFTNRPKTFRDVIWTIFFFKFSPRIVFLRQKCVCAKLQMTVMSQVSWRTYQLIISCTEA